MNYNQLVNGLQTGIFRNVCVMTGAGISVSAGIPDFRSPETGIYARIESIVGKKLPTPESLFDVRYFIKHPEVYYAYRKVRFNDRDHQIKPKPTLGHYFIKLLHQRNQLFQVLSQNTDGLHRDSGLPEGKFIDAHGTHGEAMCAKCKSPFDVDSFERALHEGSPIYCSLCQGPIKPSVVFFNESLPDSFKRAATRAALEPVDLLLIMGTTLKVGPFNSIPFKVRESIPQVLIIDNVDSVRGGSLFTPEGTDNRLLIEGDCDTICKDLTNHCEWTTQLRHILPEDLREKL